MEIRNSGQKYKIIYGGWSQRTSLHLKEIYEFFKLGETELNLNRDDLKKYWRALKIKEVKKGSDYFDFVEAKTTENINIKYFEDGLYLLEIESGNPISAKKILMDYYNDRLNLAISFIFSLGAPTTNKLTESRIHPSVFLTTSQSPENILIPEEMGQPIEKTGDSNLLNYNTNFGHLIVMKEGGENEKVANDLAEIQVFLSEFQYQLRAYLNLHRKIWEDISEIKSKKKIRGTEVDDIRNQLDNYQRIVNVINNRIDQMDIFITSRKNMAEYLNLTEKVKNYFGFKFDGTLDTLKYLQKIWKMTDNYLQTAIDNVVEIKSQSATRGIESLQLITSIGVISGIIGYLTQEEVPQFTTRSILYFVLIVAITWLINIIINKFYRSRKYSLSKNRKINI